MSDRQHPIWLTVFVATVLAVGLGYSNITFQNGADVPKDSGMIALVSGLTLIYCRFMGKRNDAEKQKLEDNDRGDYCHRCGHRYNDRGTTAGQ